MEVDNNSALLKTIINYPYNRVRDDDTYIRIVKGAWLEERYKKFKVAANLRVGPRCWR